MPQLLNNKTSGLLYQLLAFKCDFKIILIPLWCTNRVHHFLGFLAKKRFLFDAQVGGIMDHEK
jgi:hypothetical protein